jgi:hypothetical protein
VYRKFEDKMENDSLPIYDEKLINSIIKKSDKLRTLKGESDLSFEDGYDGDIIWFNPPACIKDQYDLVFMQEVVYNSKPCFLVSINIDDQDIGSTFDSMDDAVEFGKKIINDPSTCMLLCSMRPSMEQVVENIKDVAEGRSVPKQKPSIN